jgi:glycerol-1-phosphate dehydrogenase [NAD(P)+]
MVGSVESAADGFTWSCWRRGGEAGCGADFVTVPTTLAHDGISSPVASLDTNGRKVFHAAATPTGIVVDTRIIWSAPPRTLRAGVGDLVRT